MRVAYGTCLLVEQCVAVAPEFLGLIHRDIDVRQQCAQGVAVEGIDADTDRGRDVGDYTAFRHLQPVIANRGQRPLGHVHDFLAQCVRQMNSEFIAANPVQLAVFALHHFAQNAAYADHDLVACMVPEIVVDVLEVIDIDEQQCAGGCGFQAAFQAALQGMPIGQVSERVVQRHMLDAQQSLVLIRNVARGAADGTHLLRLAEDDARVDAHPAVLAGF